MLLLAPHICMVMINTLLILNLLVDSYLGYVLIAVPIPFLRKWAELHYPTVLKIIDFHKLTCDSWVFNTLVDSCCFQH